MASSPQYAATPACAALQVQAGNSARDGSGQVQTLFTADLVGAGARIDTIMCAATGVTTAGAVRFFLRSPDSGATWRFFREVGVSAVTPSASAAAWQTTLTGLALLLAPGWSLGVSSERAEGINVLITNGGVL